VRRRIRSLVGACLVKSLYQIPTWSRTAALIADHAALQGALGAAPSVYACYRFTTKLRAYKPLLDACLDRLAASVRSELPGAGVDIAIDGSDMPAYANGQRFVSKGGRERERFSDPDASWGHRSAVSTRKGGGFYGYKIHAAVCVRTGLPLARTVETARQHEASFAMPLLDAVRDRGFTVETVAMDKGYDSRAMHDACEDRDCRPSSRGSKPATHGRLTTYRPASTAAGRSPVPTTPARLRSGAAPPASAAPSRSGSRPIAATR
jgi:hypothetical protein